MTQHPQQQDKVTQLLALDKELWRSFDKLRQPYGTVNDLFEDCIRILLCRQPKHTVILERLQEVVPILSEEMRK
jgi:hypothetical protein